MITKTTMVPWLPQQEWHAVQQTLETVIERHHQRLAEAYNLADRIKIGLQRLFVYMDWLEYGCCAVCEDICCRRATVWYDLTDLIFLHLCRFTTPLSQPIRNETLACCYLTPTGCHLERINRPWICNWYLCPRQTHHLRRQPPGHRSDVKALIQSIQKHRRDLEEIFVSTAAWPFG